MNALAVLETKTATGVEDPIAAAGDRLPTSAEAPAGSVDTPTPASNGMTPLRIVQYLNTHSGIVVNKMVRVGDVAPLVSFHEQVLSKTKRIYALIEDSDLTDENRERCALHAAHIAISNGEAAHVPLSVLRQVMRGHARLEREHAELLRKYRLLQEKCQRLESRSEN